MSDPIIESEKYLDNLGTQGAAYKRPPYSQRRTVGNSANVPLGAEAGEKRRAQIQAENEKHKKKGKGKHGIHSEKQG